MRDGFKMQLLNFKTQYGLTQNNFKILVTVSAHQENQYVIFTLEVCIKQPGTFMKECQIFNLKNIQIQRYKHRKSVLFLLSNLPPLLFVIRTRRLDRLFFHMPHNFCTYWDFNHGFKSGGLNQTSSLSPSRISARLHLYRVLHSIH